MLVDGDGPLTGHACNSALSCIAHSLWREFLFPSAAIEKVTGALSTSCNGYEHSFISLISDSHTKDISTSLMRNTFAHFVGCQERSARVHLGREWSVWLHCQNSTLHTTSLEYFPQVENHHLISENDEIQRNTVQQHGTLVTTRTRQSCSSCQLAGFRTSSPTIANKQLEIKRKLRLQSRGPCMMTSTSRCPRVTDQQRFFFLSLSSPSHFHSRVT